MNGSPWGTKQTKRQERVWVGEFRGAKRERNMEELRTRRKSRKEEEKMRLQLKGRFQRMEVSSSPLRQNLFRSTPWGGKKNNIIFQNLREGAKGTRLPELINSETGLVQPITREEESRGSS